MTSTKDAARQLKQEAWAARKEEDRQLRKEPRAMGSTVASVRVKTPCTCTHARKHHTKSGHCKSGCDCAAGVR